MPCGYVQRLRGLPVNPVANLLDGLHVAFTSSLNNLLSNLGQHDLALSVGAFDSNHERIAPQFVFPS